MTAPPPYPPYPVHVPVPATLGRRGFADAGPGWLQTLITATLLVPFVVVGYLLLREVRPNERMLIWFFWAGAYAYFALLVIVFGRSAWRRVAAGLLAVVVGALDRVMWLPALRQALTDSDLSLNVLDWVYRVLFLVTVLGAVAAWGVARRRHPLWLVGLAVVPLLAVGVVVIYLVSLAQVRSTRPRDYTWLDVAVLPGSLPATWPIGVAFVVLAGALVCWGFDAGGSALRRTRTSR